MLVVSTSLRRTLQKIPCKMFVFFFCTIIIVIIIIIIKLLFIVSPVNLLPKPVICVCRPDLKLILMSATLNSEMFSAYFGKMILINDSLSLRSEVGWGSRGSKGRGGRHLSGNVPPT